MAKLSELQAMRNIGPKMAKALYEAGITSAEELQRLGAEEAYLKAYPDGDSYGDHNAAYMHALEGAIRDCDWQEIPEHTKQQYRELAKVLQSQKKR